MTTKKKTARIAPISEPNSEQFEQSKAMCFCIMPFGGYFDEYFKTIYQPAIEQEGMIARRADDLYRPSAIVNDIWEYTQQAEIILADLTGKNSNVFYELGLAHAIAKPAILIVNDMADVPFDLRALRIIEYDKNDSKWGDTLHSKIRNSIAEVRASPLNSVLPTFLKVDQSTLTSEVSAEDKTILELRSDIDLLKRQVRSKNPIRHLNSHLQARQDIRNLIRAGFDPQNIIFRMKNLGFDEDWIRSEIQDSPDKESNPWLRTKNLETLTE